MDPYTDRILDLALEQRERLARHLAAGGTAEQFFSDKFEANTSHKILVMIETANDNRVLYIGPKK